MRTDTVLVFNRGEIACRIIRTARRMGLRTVAVRAADEPDALHARMADEAICIGTDRNAFLSVEAAMTSVRKVGAGMLHPGYGFLSENAELASACIAHDIVFIGPSPDAIEAMSDKARARQIALKLGIPCADGYDGETQDDETLLQEARRIGWPVMVKAAAGGGGKGMRLVTSQADLPSALRAARSEALASFGSDRLILEQALLDARHIEVQVFGDMHGTIVHLGERDCSIQRRHQKLIEETPAPNLLPATRAAIVDASCRLSGHIGYASAGTVEYLVASDGSFHFLEMNTRLQVEHGVTESVTGIDLVEWQIRIARGERLPLSQERIVSSGHAIEARICAETADGEFQPGSGNVSLFHMPDHTGVRIDTGIGPETRVTPGYDSLLAKVIAHGNDREEARLRLGRALRELSIAGIATNRGLMVRAVDHPAFVAGEQTTAFISQFADVIAVPEPGTITFAIGNCLLDTGDEPPDTPPAPRRSRRHVRLGSETRLVKTRLSQGAWEMEMPCGQAHVLGRTWRAGDWFGIEVDGTAIKGRLAWHGTSLFLSLRDMDVHAADVSLNHGRETACDSAVRSPMEGRLVRMLVTDGQRVEQAAPIAIVEAMKMEQELRAPVSGKVELLVSEPGAALGRDEAIARIEPQTDFQGVA